MTEHAPGEVARAVHRVFSDPAYVDEARQWEVGSWFLQLLARVRELYDEALRRLLSLLAGQGSWLGYLVAAAVTLVLVWALVLLARSLVRGARLAAADEELAPEPPRIASSRELYARAHALAAEGRWADALRHLVLTLVAHLRADRRLRWSDAWTNHELAARVRVPGAHAGELDRLVDAVDRAWYGRRDATRAEFDEGCALVSDVAGFPERGP